MIRGTSYATDKGNIDDIVFAVLPNHHSWKHVYLCQSVYQFNILQTNLPLVLSVYFISLSLYLLFVFFLLDFCFIQCLHMFFSLLVGILIIFHYDGTIFPIHFNKGDLWGGFMAAEFDITTGELESNNYWFTLLLKNVG